MKFLTLTMLLVVANVWAARPPHLDLEMTSSEYENLIRKNSPNKSLFDTSDDPAITEAMKIGMRLSKWIALINSGRTPEAAIRLTSASTRRGIPIDKPNTYSPSIIKAETQAILAALPQEMKDVILSSSQLPGAIKIDDETFILHARKLDRNYQSAARYKSLDPYRIFYMGKARNDVRGYYYLTKNKITADSLKEVSQIPASQVKDIKAALAMICFNNSGALSFCHEELDEAFTKNKVSEFFSSYYPSGKAMWDSFFKINPGHRRKDLKWTSTSVTVPFNTPDLPKFTPYLKDNIEDEFRFGNWGLKLSFGKYPNGPRLKFETGVVPHVDTLGGNTIVMDANQPIEEYESQWTIRHEFGHVLGLPDCYHEFYDMNLNAYVNYQLDITDLMCSRAGNMNERIYQELKEAYAP